MATAVNPLVFFDLTLGGQCSARSAPGYLIWNSHHLLAGYYERS